MISLESQTDGEKTSRLGRKGETLAINYIQSLGFLPILTNFKAPIGRNTRGVQVSGEIDIIAREGDVLCFVEVKSRRSVEFADPIAAVTRRKQRQIARTARVYRRIFRLNEIVYRYDVVTVILADEKKPMIELVRGFWSDAVLRKKVWSCDLP